MISVTICSRLAISRLTLLIAYLFLGLSRWSCPASSSSRPTLVFLCWQGTYGSEVLLVALQSLGVSAPAKLSSCPPCLLVSLLGIPYHHTEIPQINCAPPYCRYQGVRLHWRSFVYHSLHSRIKTYTFFFFLAFSQHYLQFLSILLVAFDIKNSHRTLQTHQC